MVHRSVLTAVAVMLAAAMAAMAQAPPAEPEDVKMTVDALKQRNRDLERRLTELESKMGASAEQQAQQREEIRKLIDQTIAENKKLLSPDWMENLKFSGDLRLRYEFRRRESGLQNDESRARFRLRFGFEKSWPNEDLSVGFRLASGSSNDPTSTNQTMTMFQKDPVWIDRAYAKWAPKAVKGFSITGGKMANPWETSDMIWDPDVNPDGVIVQYDVPGLGPITPFVSAGVFQLYAPENTTRPNSDLMTYSVGNRFQITKDIKWTLAANFFEYSNLDSALAGAAFAGRGGNTNIRDSRFHMFDLSNKVEFTAFNLPMAAHVDWVQNNDNNLATHRNTGFAAGLKVGQNKKKGDWSARYQWKKLEADAVPDYFAESDFGWNTFTNRKGHLWGVDYNITDNMTAGLTFFLTEPIKAAGANIMEDRFTLQADLVWKF
jgi:hypothetical protein